MLSFVAVNPTRLKPMTLDTSLTDLWNPMSAVLFPSCQQPAISPNVRTREEGNNMQKERNTSFLQRTLTHFLDCTFQHSATTAFRLLVRARRM